jgi:superfamily II DNA or RNA helicase
MKTYQQFLQRKLITTKPAGFDLSPSSISPVLFDWQNEITRWAVRQGRAALFEECGLGKTLQQIEWAKHVQQYTGGNVLIVAPLAVAHQTIGEGQKIGTDIAYVRHQDEFAAPGIYITNYDMLKEFDGGEWAGVVLDESSILKNYTGATKRLILEMFESAPYKLACTATPAPNDHLELGNHAEFLGAMKSNEMIQRWFINDTMSAGSYRLKRHAEKDFWQWVTSWAVCISRPSDIGYPDTCDRYSFDMPKLNIRSEVVRVDHSRAWASGRLIVDGTLSATDLWKEKRATMDDRIARAREIVGDSSEAWVIWCDTNEEADALKLQFPAAVEVRGSDSIREKERKLTAFSSGEVKQIITKADIAGYGLNWQHCHKMIFVGLTYSFEKTYQALRRSWRFGQTEDVDAYLVSAESEGDILKVLEVKQDAHREMQHAMNRAMREHGLGVSDRRDVRPYDARLPMQLPSWIGAQ